MLSYRLYITPDTKQITEKGYNIPHVPISNPSSHLLHPLSPDNAMLMQKPKNQRANRHPSSSVRANLNIPNPMSFPDMFPS
ncbi:hypothetical protein VTJ04DRAFT_2219 [Mycothermus thermophilus]|uniref:uncharacterized protein n=1 Tax=Humicola insolens TaxID=85995 RepID=UPI003742ECCE